MHRESGMIPSVGVRELKNKLSHYLDQVNQGKRIEITRRGRVVALLIPAIDTSIDMALLALIEEGMAFWAGGKPKGAIHRVSNRGRALAELIVEDRR